MLLSVYTYIKNSIQHDLHAIDMLKHHLPLADEIIVNEGFSTDGTYELISKIDSKIRIFQTVWAKPADSFAWYIPLKDAARRECKGEWCLHLDADEFVPEWEFEEIRRFIRTTSEHLAAFHFLNFYGNYKVYHPNPEAIRWPGRKMILHRNRPDIEFWGDGANVRMAGTELKWEGIPLRFHCHHFGTVRDPGTLRHKWYVQGAMYRGIRRWFQLPSFLFRLLPHDWRDPEFYHDLQTYEGPYVKAVLDNPKEFIRDGMRLYNEIKSRNQKVVPGTV